MKNLEGMGSSTCLEHIAPVEGLALVFVREGELLRVLGRERYRWVERQIGLQVVLGMRESSSLLLFLQ